MLTNAMTRVSKLQGVMMQSNLVRKISVCSVFLCKQKDTVRSKQNIRCSVWESLKSTADNHTLSVTSRFSTSVIFFRVVMPHVIPTMMSTVVPFIQQAAQH